MDFLFGRYSLMVFAFIGAIIFGLAGAVEPVFLVIALLLGLMAVIGLYDYHQKKRAVLGNYPLIGRFRFLFESIRPELRQYFWESDTDELPYSRNQRAMVYQRAKSITCHAVVSGRIRICMLKISIGSITRFNQSEIESSDFRVRVGEGDKAYDASVLNISGTSFGALSPPAIQSLSAGAKLGGFAHNTGEGSLSKYHLAGGGDTIWQIATGYFGCRTADGQFDPEAFRARACS